MTDVVPPPRNRLQVVPGMSTVERLDAVQVYIESLQYNYTGQSYVPLKRNRGMSHIYSAAKELIKVALPIQCVEAVFIGCYLSSNITDIDRIPLSFKSIFGRTIHRHIVLAIRHNGLWGCLGLSRRSNLMNKPFVFHSLENLIREFEKSYEQVYHRLLTVYLGLPMMKNFESDQPIKWRAMKIRIYNREALEISQRISYFCEHMHDMREIYCLEGSLPSIGKQSLETKTPLAKTQDFSCRLPSSGADPQEFESGCM